MQFEFASGRIVFGRGSLARLPELVRDFSGPPLLVTGSNPQRATSRIPFPVELFTVPGEPTLDLVRTGVAAARRQQCGYIIGFGGGSALDTAKAIAALVPNSGEPLDYLEVIGKGQPLTAPGLPCLAIPTTAGTGAEVTRNAVLGSPEHHLKASLRGPQLLPRLALVDPELTDSVPQQTTATTGLDALTQLIEAFVSARANPFTDAMCRDGLRLIRDALPAAYHNGGDQEARDHMAYASLLSGLALANAGLGVVHGFAAPLGGMLNASHGAICAALLVAGVRANLAALTARKPESPALNKFAEAAALLTNGHADLVDWLTDLTRKLNVQRLTQLGLHRSQLNELIPKAARANSMKANPIELTNEELCEVAESSL